ncbi:MAG TPA: nucleotide pyrophosphatase, partial [Anaerolineae bacterium]|nr:nucleotide pyrophosphatase [Anaerolineae bacterium]
MGLFSRLKKRHAPQVVFIGLDGTPYSLIQRMISEGVMPNMAELAQEGSLRRMSSVYPWVSSVAWSTFMTGCNPAKHGIYGFVDRDPATMKTYIPLSRHMRAPTLWDILSQAGKRSIVVNVPVTYPPKEINGILVSGFLSPNLDKAVYPPSLLPTLKQLGYRVDTNPWLARESREKAMPDILDALEKRTRTLLHLMDHEQWDVFLGIVMETDRLHHFYFEPMEQNDPVWAPAFFDLYRRVDDFIGQVRQRLDDNTRLILMSDHGFCSIKQEVFYNHWLAEAGYLKYSKPPEEIKGPDLSAVHPDSVAYSMDPGRIFVNLQGREKVGRVAPGAPYERLRDELIEAAEALTAPQTGERVVRKAYRREEIYNGPYLQLAADIILAPADG